MRIKHRIPTIKPKPVVLDARYAAEVERSTLKGERAYAKAQDALARAELRLRQAERTQDQRRIRVARELAELRRAELEELESMMCAAPASATHRGDRSYRPVPPSSGSLL